MKSLKRKIHWPTKINFQ